MIPSLNSISFAANIESLVTAANLSYIDAILHFCDKNSLEVEGIVKYLGNTTVLYSKLELEAEQLNFLPKQTRLPVD
jgi:hypothetical protein